MPDELRHSPKKHNIYRKSPDLNRDELVADFFGRNWIEIISSNTMVSNFSFDNFIGTVNSVFVGYMP